MYMSYTENEECGTDTESGTMCAQPQNSSIVQCTVIETYGKLKHY